MANTPNTPDKPLTERQQQILDHINDYWRQHSRPPSVRDICKASGISSPNGVYCHLLALIAKGELLPIPATGMSRSIIPLWVVKAISDASQEDLGIDISIARSGHDEVPVIEIDTSELDGDSMEEPRCRIYLNDFCMHENPVYEEEHDDD